MKPTMYDNFNMLEERVLDSLENTDLERISSHLKKITSKTISVGVGGSSVVSTYAAKILAAKNNIITSHEEPRTLNYKNINGYDNVLACSYGGNNKGVQMAFENNLNKFLLSSNPALETNITSLQYKTTLPKEDSFISLAATLIPMSILLSYYTDLDLSIIKEILKTKKEYSLNSNKVFEILSGYDTNTAATYLETTFSEAALALPLIHDKYSYCHGRTTTSYHNQNSLIHLAPNTELDSVIKESSYPYYHEVIELPSAYDDPIINDFYLTYQAMFLSKDLAEKTAQDLSRVDYSPATKKLYKFKGQM